MAKNRKKLLENYIAKKLKKEERKVLFARLAESSFSHEALYSSSSIGQKRKQKECDPVSMSMPEQEQELKIQSKEKMPQDKQSPKRQQASSIGLEWMKKETLDRTKPTKIGGNVKVNSTGHEESSENDETSESDTSTLESHSAELSHEHVNVSPLPPTLPSLNDAAFDIPAKHQAELSDTLLDEPSPLSDFSVHASSADYDALFKQLNHGPPFRYDLTSSRPVQFLQMRSELPILACEAEFIHLFRHHLVLLIVGQTGSGKTTQVPQFLLEMGYGIVDWRQGQERGQACVSPAVAAHHESPLPPGGRVAITQPRRLAAISTAARVQAELGEQEAHRVSYQVRYESTVSPNTGLHFMTDGILLRYIAQDFLLSDYSVIVLDEAHERNMNTDILIGLLTRIVQLRAKLYLAAMQKQERENEKENEKILQPLRLIIMSATLNVTDFTENRKLFPPHSSLPPPPLLSIPGRQWPVAVRYAKRTPTSTDQCLHLAARLVRRVHQKTAQGSGAILVFVAGQSDVWNLIRRLQGKKRDKDISDNSENEENSMSKEYDKEAMSKPNTQPSLTEAKVEPVALKTDSNRSDALSSLFDLDNVEHQSAQEVNTPNVKENHSNASDSDSDSDSCSDSNSNSDSGSGSDSDSDSDFDSHHSDDLDTLDDLLLLPLYANLPIHRQLLVFEEANKRERQVKEATLCRAHSNNDRRDCDGNDDHDDVNVDSVTTAPKPTMQTTASSLPRLCIIATNVAETSITIPGVRYVIDSGKVKERKLVAPASAQQEDHRVLLSSSSSATTFDTCTSLSLTWTSRASADQRAGRAGRTGPGYCWRLYSAAVYHELFDEYNTPEIQRMALHSLVLYMKRMNIVHVQGFPFPTSPSPSRLAGAERLLVELGALTIPSATPHASPGSLPLTTDERAFSGTLTELGRQMSVFPIDPRQAKVLLAATRYPTLFPYILRLVAGLAVGDPFDTSSQHDVSEQDKALPGSDNLQRSPHVSLDSTDSDLIRLLRAICGYEYEETESQRWTFCQRHRLRPATMKEILLMKDQLHDLFHQHFQLSSSLASYFPPRSTVMCAAEKHVKSRLQPLPRSENAKLVQLFLVGYPRHVAKLQDTKLKWIAKPSQAYATSQGEAFIDRNSGLIHEKNMTWLAYERLERNEHNVLFMKNCSKIELEWIKL